MILNIKKYCGRCPSNSNLVQKIMTGEVRDFHSISSILKLKKTINTTKNPLPFPLNSLLTYVYYQFETLHFRNLGISENSNS